MICKNCNFESDKDFAFCPKCGAKCEPEEPQVTTEETTVLQPSDSPFNVPEAMAENTAQPDFNTQTEQTPDGSFFNQPEQNVISDDEKPKKKKKWPVITAIIAAIVLILGALTWIFLPRIEMMVLGKGGYYLKQELNTFDRYGDISEVLNENTEEASVNGDLKFTVSGSEVPDDTQEILDKLVVSMDLKTEPDSNKSYGKVDFKYDGESLFDMLIQSDGKKSSISFPSYDENKQLVADVVDPDATLVDSLAKTLDVDADVITELRDAVASQALTAALEAEDAEVDSGEFKGTSCTIITYEITDDSVKAFLEELKTIIEDDENFETLLKALYDYAAENNLLNTTEEKFDFDEYSKNAVDTIDNAIDNIEFDEDITYTVYIENGLFSRGDVLSRVIKIDDEKIEVNTYEKDETHVIEVIASEDGDKPAEINIEYTTEDNQLKGKFSVKADDEEFVDCSFRYRNLTDFEIKADINEGEGSFVYKSSKDKDKVNLALDITIDGNTVSIGGDLDYSDKVDSIDTSINDKSNLDSSDIQSAAQSFVYKLYSKVLNSTANYSTDTYVYSNDDYYYDDYDYDYDDYDYYDYDDYDDYDYDDYDY